MITLYNTINRKKEEFIPIKENIVKIYSCGPTVYSVQHIGNMRAALTWDFLKRMLRYFNFKVIDVANITDVGHLVSDESDGEDKMLKAAKKEKLDPFKIARKYEDIYLTDLEKLNILKAKYLPRATEHIKEQIEIISDLEKGGYIYTISDGVYFDVSKFESYGKLSGQSLEDKKAGARVEEKSEKRNAQDFALWKFAVAENKNHIMKWESPWGIGFPGWHIECSAMSHKYLGSEFDIHTGGIEHIPVHHENEIAQNTCSHAVEKINYWMHNAHLIVDGEKMSKSIGNVYNIVDLEEKGYSPLAFRELVLRTHYRKTLNFTIESLDAGTINVKKINDFYHKINHTTPSINNEDSISKIYNKYLDNFEVALKDDLSTPLALTAVYEFMNEINRKSIFSEIDLKQIKKFIIKTDTVLGLLEKEIEIPNEIIRIAEERKTARTNKDFKTSDELRLKLNNFGFEIKDSKDSKSGYIITKL